MSTKYYSMHTYQTKSLINQLYKKLKSLLDLLLPIFLVSQDVQAYGPHH